MTDNVFMPCDLVNHQTQRTINSIYSHLGDDLSKKIFTDRLMYSLTGDMAHIHRIINTNEVASGFFKRLDSILKKQGEIVVYGAGATGHNFLSYYPRYVKCFVDKNYENMQNDRLPVHSPNWLKNNINENTYVLIAVAVNKFHNYHYEIVTRLQEMGIPTQNIIDLCHYEDQLLTAQYFDLPFLSWSSGGVFLDCGSFDGSSTLRFIEKHNAKTGKSKGEVIAFEPVLHFYEALKNEILVHLGENITAEVINAASWNVTDQAFFKKMDDCDMLVQSDSGEFKINTVRIDDVMADCRVDFIKMDIEGAEYNALLGAELTIRTQKPQLAISIYHKPQDIVALPEIILNFYSNYKLYLRHYSIYPSETILYAIPQ